MPQPACRSFLVGPTKKPMINDWPNAASTDEAVIRSWWDRWPQALVAIVTGRRSGLFVVDLDVKNGHDGIAAYSVLDLPKTEIAVLTASGGGHAYFRWPGEGWGNTGSKIAPGIDTRGEVGYVIAPPSCIGERAYQWGTQAMLDRLQRGDVPELPEVLRRRLSPHGRVPDVRPAHGSATPWAEKAFRGEVERVSSAEHGQRNDVLNTAAFSLGQIVGGGELDRARVEAALLEAASAAGLPDGEARATIASGLSKGVLSPRTSAGPKSGPAAAPGAADQQWPAPDLSLLEAEREAPPTLPVRDIFGERWGEWIQHAAEGKGAPIDYVAGALIAAAASLVGNARWAHPYGDWREPLIFWVMLVGNPSSRKSPGLDAVRAPLQALADRLEAELEPAHSRWREKKERAELYREAWRERAKQAAKKGLSLPARPPEADPGEEPHIPRLEVNDATVEGLTKILERQPRGTLVVRDELAGWLGGMNRYNAGSSDRPFWIEAYGGRRHAVDRVSKERAVVRRLTVSLVGAIQPEPLNSLLLKPDDDGLVARFCPFWPSLSPPKRPTARGDTSFAAEAFARLLGLEMGEDELGEAAPILVPFSGAAQDLIDEFCSEVSRLELEAEGEGLLVSFVGKLPGTAVRLALLLSLLDWAADGVGPAPTEVSVGCIERAIAFAAAYVLPMARRTYSAACGKPADRTARRLAKLIIDERLTGFTAREIYRRKLSGLRNGQEVKAAARMLVEAGILRGGPRSGVGADHDLGRQREPRPAQARPR